MTKKVNLFAYLFTGLFAYLFINQLSVLKTSASNYDYLLQNTTIDVFPASELTSLRGRSGPESGSWSSQAFGSEAQARRDDKREGRDDKEGYSVESSDDFLSVSLLETIIDFGIISPLSPVTRSQNLEIKGSPGIRYSAFNFKETQNTIPDTSCDDGLCNDKTAYLWTNALTYGLGFRCDNIKGTGCSADFNQADYYRKIVNWIPAFAGMTKWGNGGDSKGLLRGESLLNEPFLKGILSLNSTKTRLTYKINVAKAQEKGLYQNEILYIILPQL